MLLIIQNRRFPPTVVEVYALMSSGRSSPINCFVGDAAPLSRL